MEGLPPESEDDQDSEVEYNKSERNLLSEAHFFDASEEEALKEMLMKMEEQERNAEKEKISCEPTEVSETKPVVEELVAPAPKEAISLQIVKPEAQPTNGNFKNISVVACDEVLKVSSQKLSKEESHPTKVEAEYYESRIRDSYEADDIPNLECDESIFDDSEESEVHLPYPPTPVVMVPVSEVKDLPERENQSLTKETENKEKKAKTRRKESKEAKNIAMTSSKEPVLDERTFCYLDMSAKMCSNLVRGGTSGSSGIVDDGMQDVEVRRDVEEMKECSTNETERKRVSTAAAAATPPPSSSAKKKAKKKISGECKDLEITTVELKEVNLPISKKNSSISASSKVSKFEKIDKCAFPRTKEFKDTKHNYLSAVPNSSSKSEIRIEPICTSVLKSLSSAGSAELSSSSEKAPEQVPGGCHLETVRSLTSDSFSNVSGGSGVQSELVVSSNVAVSSYLPGSEPVPSDSEDVTSLPPPPPPQQQQQTSQDVDHEETPQDVDHEEEDEEDDDFDDDEHEEPMRRDPLPGGESPHECNASTISNDSCGSSSGNIPSSDSSNDVAPPPTAKRKREDLEFMPAKKKKRTNKTNKTGIERRRETKPSECEESYSVEDKGAETSSPEYEASPISHALSTHSSLPKSNSITSKPPRISKYNFNLDEAQYLDGEKLITFLMDKIQQIRRIYMNLKTEVASIDRRRKRAKRKERENSQTASNLEVECV